MTMVMPGPSKNKDPKSRGAVPCPISGGALAAAVMDYALASADGGTGIGNDLPTGFRDQATSQPSALIEVRRRSASGHLRKASDRASARHAVLLLFGAAALSGCAEPSDVALSRVTPAREEVTVEGIDFETTLRDGPPGERLTPMGAVPTAGLGVIVRRADGAELANSEGRIAKAAAEKGCNAAGGTFNRAVLGRYEGAGTWVFDGVCT